MSFSSKKITKFFQKEWSWLIFGILFCVLIFIATPESLETKKQLLFILYSIFILFSIFHIFKIKTKTKRADEYYITKQRKFFVGLLLFAIVFLLITRLMPFIRYGEAPLGYDTGIYVKNMSTVEAPLVTEKIFYLAMAPLQLLGLPDSVTLHFFTFLTQILIAGALYILFRSLKIPSPFAFATIAVFLFMGSVVQFHAYWWMFARQMFATSFFMISFALLFRRLPLILLTGVVGVLAHTLPFVAFGIALIAFFFFYISKKFFWDKASSRRILLFFVLIFSGLGNIIYWNWDSILVWFYNFVVNSNAVFQQGVSKIYPIVITGGLIVFLAVINFFIRKRLKKGSLERSILNYSVIFLSLGIIIAVLRWDALSGQIAYFLRFRGLATNYIIPWNMAAVKGLFINFDKFYDLSFFMVPFAFLGLLCPIIWRRDKEEPGSHSKYPYKFVFLTSAMFVILFIFSFFPFIRQHRFIILFSLTMIMLSVPAVYHLINHFLKDKLGRILITLFLCIFVYRISAGVWQQEPQLYPDELQDIQQLALTTEHNAQVIATSSAYTPWVHGYSGREGFGPGWGADKWNLENWMSYWFSQKDDADDYRYELLNRYEVPIYFFIGRRDILNAPYCTFMRSSPDFLRISDHVWKYNPQ